MGGIKMFEEFKVTDDKTLSWTLKKIKELNKEKARIEELAKYEVEQIKKWEEQESSKINDSISNFSNLISQYAEEQRRKDEKFKKITTPYGNVKFVKQQDKYVYNDELLLKQFEEEGFEDLIRIKKEVNKEQLKKSLIVNENGIYLNTGTKLEGLEIIKQEDKIKIEVNGDDE